MCRVRLAIGSAQFGLDYGISNHTGQVTLSEGSAVLNLARANGISTIDTAIGYGNSECRLGQIGVQNWKIVTKLPAIPDGCKDIYRWMNTSINDSLGRLKVNNLYGILLHRPQQLLEKDGELLYLALQRLKEKKIVKKVGISIYDPSELDVLLDKYKLDLVQAPFNVFDHRLIESGWMRELSERGVELHVRSIFLQGLLLMTNENRPVKFNRWHNLWNCWGDWLQASDLSATEACVRYALSFPEISQVIIGVNSQQQLSEIIKASNGSVPILPNQIISREVDLINPACWKI